ncbi:hypothetical protein C8R45DRAFT_1113283 [Mycena sanguinolenta]|nr:hypothetical protein C8R45DRAFT_1113283 [Mycena sanguinolenta]
MSDAEDEHGRVFNIPDQNASPGTLRKALIETQKVAGAALKQNQVLRAENARAEASKPGRKTKDSAQPRGLKGPNTLGYHNVIISLGKSFTVLEFPWIDTSAFSTKVSFPEASPSDIWKPRPVSPMLPQQLTATIYKHVPQRYHCLVDATGQYGLYFGENFCHHASAQRSTSLKTLKTELPGILISQKFITDVRDRNAWRALIVLPEDMAKSDVKVSLYPPVIYHKAKRNPTGFMKSSVLPLCARAILFGPASLQDDGSRRPQSSTLGQMWNVTKPNGGLISFVCTLVVFICYWMSVGEGKENFEPVSSTSKIDFREIYLRFRRALESKPEDAKAIFRFWHERVFKGITGVPSLPSNVPGDVDEDEELEKAMGGLDFDDHSLLYSDEEADVPNPAPRTSLRRVETPPGNTEHDRLALNPRGSAAAPGQRADGPVSRTARPSGQVDPGPLDAFHAEHAPSAGSDSEIDESISSPVRVNQRQANVIYSDDDEPLSQPADNEKDAQADGPAEDAEAAGREADLRQLEAQLKGLTVVKLRSFLKTAQQTIRSKATKNEIVAAILANDKALDAYLADLE